MNNLTKIAIGGLVAGALAVGGIVTEPKTLPVDKIIESEIVGDVAVYKYVSEVEVLVEKDEDLTKRTENSQTFQVADNTFVVKIYSGTTFNKDEKTGKWYEVETATTTTETFLKETTPLLGLIKQVYADTIYAGAGDGVVEKSNSTSWSTTHNAATGESASPVTTTATAFTSQNLFSSIYSIDRAFLPFDTSSIPSNALITSASLSVYVTTVSGLLNDDGYDYVNVVQTSQPSSTTFTTADYDLVGAISNPPTGSTAKDVMTDFTASAYNTFTLNSTGLGWIKVNGQNSACGTSKGTTCLGLREGHDIQNVAPGVGGQGITISTSEETGTSQDPYLEVTYIIPIATVDLKANTILQGNMIIK